MKLTRLQRYTAYCIMLEELEDYLLKRPDFHIAYDGFCFLLFRLFDSDDMKTSIDCFPELLNRKPKNAYWLWWKANRN